MTELTSSGQRQRRLAPLRSGVYAKNSDALKLRYRKVSRITVKMKRAMPWLRPSDEPACRAWAELEILSASVWVELTVGGHLTDKGQPRRLLSEYRLLRQAQLSYERELGMTPMARMQLQVGDSRSRALDVSAELERGRQARVAAEARQTISEAAHEDSDADEGESA